MVREITYIKCGRLRPSKKSAGKLMAVSTFAASSDYAQMRGVQQQILADFEADFGKHAPARLVERMRMVWHSVPSQLARENRRFVYGAVRKGARAKDLEEAIQWLRDYVGPVADRGGNRPGDGVRPHRESK